MSKCSRIIAQWCIRLERFIRNEEDDEPNEIDNDAHNLAIDNSCSNIDRHHDEQLLVGREGKGEGKGEGGDMHLPLLHTQTSSTLPSPTRTASTPRPRSRHNRRSPLYMSLLYLLLLLLESGYYLFAFLVFTPEWKNQEKNHQFRLWVVWEMVSIIIALRCVASCPIHLVLLLDHEEEECHRQGQPSHHSGGEQHRKRSISKCENNDVYELLVQDKATTGILVSVIALGLGQVILDFIKIYGSSSRNTTNIWIWLAYFPFSLLNSITLFLPFLTVLVSLRIILIQVYELDRQIHQEVVAVRQRRMSVPQHPPPPPPPPPAVQTNTVTIPPRQESSYVSLNDFGTALRATRTPSFEYHQASPDVLHSWSTQYATLRYMTNQQFSRQVAPLFCWVLLMMFIELTTFYIQILKGLFTNVASNPLLLEIAITGFYYSYVMALGLALSQLSRSVSLCQQNLGPKLATLALQFPNHHEYALLSFAVATYPIRVHVGSLGIKPEHAITAVVSMIGAYLIAMGYQR